MNKVTLWIPVWLAHDGATPQMGGCFPTEHDAVRELRIKLVDTAYGSTVAWERLKKTSFAIRYGGAPEEDSCVVSFRGHWMPRGWVVKRELTSDQVLVAMGEPQDDENYYSKMAKLEQPLNEDP